MTASAGRRSALSDPLASWHNLPPSAVFAVGVANVLYGRYSLYVTTRRPRPWRLVAALAVANMAWGVVCTAIVVWYWDRITVTGIALIGGEGV